jgi:hypothetical protein
MKIIALLTSAILSVFLFNNLSHQSSPAKSTNQMSSEERFVYEIDSLSVNFACVLYIEQAAKETLRVEADDNILPAINTTMSGKRLLISFDEKVAPRPESAITIYLSVKDLEKIELSGASQIYSEGVLKFQDINLDVQGSSLLSLDIETKRLEAEIRGKAKFLLRGHAINQFVHINGAGKYQADELISKNAQVKISGSGKAAIFANNALDAKVNGTGRLRYSGQPRITKEVSGAGRIESVKT